MMKVITLMEAAKKMNRRAENAQVIIGRTGDFLAIATPKRGTIETEWKYNYGFDAIREMFHAKKIQLGHINFFDEYEQVEKKNEQVIVLFF